MSTWRDEARKRLDDFTNNASLVRIVVDPSNAGMRWFLHADTDLRRALDLLDECEKHIESLTEDSSWMYRDALLAKLREER